MIASLSTHIVAPFSSFEILVEVSSGDISQIYRVLWAYGDSMAKWGIDDKGDPRRAMGLALQGLGRSLLRSHGEPLVPS